MYCKIKLSTGEIKEVQAVVKDHGLKGVIEWVETSMAHAATEGATAITDMVKRESTTRIDTIKLTEGDINDLREAIVQTETTPLIHKLEDLMSLAARTQAEITYQELVEVEED